MKKINNKLKKSFTIGLDLGGTKLAAALVDETGKILSYQKENILQLKFDPKKGPQKITELMGSMIQNFKKQFPQCFLKEKFLGIGLASAGPLNVETGQLLFPVNFPGWKIINIKQLLEKELVRKKLPSLVFFQNDAVAAALAEKWIGKAKGLHSFAVITIGTGIGTGILFNDKPVQFSGMGSEFGHLIIENSKIKTSKDRKFYTVEGLASGTGILRQAKSLGFDGNSVEELIAFIENPKSELLHIDPQQYENLKNQYLALFTNAGKALAALSYNLCIGFHLERILFSGGLICARHLYFETLKSEFKNLIYDFNPAFNCQLTLAKGLNKAGVIGAAYLPYLKI